MNEKDFTYLNIEFLEEYKKLNNLCSDAYGVANGITHYIDTMKNVPSYESSKIANWNYNLEQLKKYRHIRNSFAHETDTFTQSICSENDIIWLKDFYQNMLQSNDPLAILYRQRNYIRPENSMQIKPDTYYIRPENDVKTPRSNYILIIVCIVFLIIIILFYLFLKIA
ncbi:MAG: hypothetical protein IJM37_02095 [Lachnospiraceae bacterium]|nr:hypothetical protein [Lachnospiraceae bacterium]